MAGHNGKISQTNTENVPNKHLVDYNENTISIDHHQKSNSRDHFLSTKLRYADCRSDSGHLPKIEEAFVEKMVIKKQFFPYIQKNKTK